MGLTSSRTIIPIKEAHAKLGHSTLIKLEKVCESSSMPSFCFRTLEQRTQSPPYSNGVGTSEYSCNTQVLVVLAVCTTVLYYALIV